MRIDSAVITHYKADVIPFDKLATLIKLNRKYLSEKKTWYLVEGQLEYFKKRADLRLFAELFFQEFARETVALDTLIYRLAYIREVNHCQKANCCQNASNNGKTSTCPNIKIDSEDKKQLGLLSPSFQTPGNNYYLASELICCEHADLCQYGGYNLKTLLKFFHDYLDPNGYEVVKDFLIRLFIIDALLLQFDRNPNNICFEIPAIQGVSHTKRLRPHQLLTDIQDKKDILDLSDPEMPKLLGFKPSLVYDNERILNIDHNNVILSNPQTIWTPVFPYSAELDFKGDLEQALLISELEYDGLDPNLTELCFEHYDACKDYLDQLARDDIWRKILEGYSKPNNPIMLTSSQRENVEFTILKRQADLGQVLKLFR